MEQQELTITADNNAKGYSHLEDSLKDSYKTEDAEHIMRNAGLQETQAGIKITGRNINDLRYADDYPYGRKERRTKEPLDESERGE